MAQAGNRNPHQVTVNLTDKDARVLDALVKSGIATSRRGAIAWCIRHFNAKEVDWLRGLQNAVEPQLTTKEREERDLIYKVATRISKSLELEINATPTGRVRDLLTDTAIILDVYRSGGHLQTLANRLKGVAAERGIKEDV